MCSLSNCMTLLAMDGLSGKDPVIVSLWSREFSVCRHLCNFERHTFTKLLIDQWSATSLSSTPCGLYDLQQAADLPDPHCHSHKMKMKLSARTKLNALKSSLHLWQ